VDYVIETRKREEDNHLLLRSELLSLSKNFVLDFGRNSLTFHGGQNGRKQFDGHKSKFFQVMNLFSEDIRPDV